MRYLTIMLALVLTLGGCGLFNGTLEDRAADYYNYMVGNSPKTKASSFISPAYRSTLDIKAYNEATGRGKSSSGSHGTAAAEDIVVAERDGFAITVINPEKGRAFSNLEPVKWVKAGRQWYLYIGSSAEESRYGPFPLDLTPPMTGRLTPLMEEIDLRPEQYQ